MNLSMQGKVEGRWITGVIDEFVGSRMAGKFESATDHPFIKPFEPTEPAAAVEVDVGGMYNLFDRGIPSQADPCRADIKYAHSAGGDD